MIEPDFDTQGRMISLSIVQPLTEMEHEALLAACMRWKNQPVVWTHNLPEVKIIPLMNGRFEPDIEDTP